MNFLLLSPDTLSLDMALTRCLPGGNPVKVPHPEESLTVCNALKVATTSRGISDCIRGEQLGKRGNILSVALSLT